MTIEAKIKSDERLQRVRALERDIERSVRTCYEAGLKLRQIRDEELYKEDGFITFQAFCGETFEFPPAEAERLIADATRWEMERKTAEGDQSAKVL
jgi:hypothetical protein